MKEATIVKPTQIKLYATKKYDSFKYFTGNRPLDKGHIRKLKDKIEEEGNLTSEFPVNVNEDLYVIDGQHRIEALRQLGYPVYYTVSEGGNLNTVRQINVARRNWTWTDYANSYAQEGNVHYKDLLDFHEIHPRFGQHTLVRYCNGGKSYNTKNYQEGNFKVLDRGLTFGLLNRLDNVADALPFIATQSFCAAMYDVITHPDYDQKRMVNKLTTHGSQLKEWSKKKDWLRNIEEIYNYGYTEDKRTRFF